MLHFSLQKQHSSTLVFPPHSLPVGIFLSPLPGHNSKSGIPFTTSRLAIFTLSDPVNYSPNLPLTNALSQLHTRISSYSRSSLVPVPTQQVLPKPAVTLIAARHQALRRKAAQKALGFSISHPTVAQKGLRNSISQQAGHHKVSSFPSLNEISRFPSPPQEILSLRIPPFSPKISSLWISPSSTEIPSLQRPPFSPRSHHSEDLHVIQRSLFPRGLHVLQRPPFSLKISSLWISPSSSEISYLWRPPFSPRSHHSGDLHLFRKSDQSKDLHSPWNFITPNLPLRKFHYRILLRPHGWTRRAQQFHKQGRKFSLCRGSWLKIKNQGRNLKYSMTMCPSGLGPSICCEALFCCLFEIAAAGRLLCWPKCIANRQKLLGGRILMQVSSAIAECDVAGDAAKEPCFHFPPAGTRDGMQLLMHCGWIVAENAPGVSTCCGVVATNQHDADDGALPLLFFLVREVSFSNANGRFDFGGCCPCLEDYEGCSLPCVAALDENLMLRLVDCRQAEGTDGMLLAGDVNPAGTCWHTKAEAMIGVHIWFLKTQPSQSFLKQC
ncbi:hypothetical protein Nepgr_024725 [Nepenthes gracilis]|uniref:Uncharacterized protein n=1 Tax=Nepenthes gracilis TaxID=150966 RepID=A0AAD3T527_NEPGR|nr:hypothetical protein Nepgr_024725 [Nepenthes gracilis]